jgi:protein-L-isoaspartate(D-aspartate) O-methyltransferase
MPSRVSFLHGHSHRTGSGSATRAGLGLVIALLLCASVTFSNTRPQSPAQDANSALAERDSEQRYREARRRMIKTQLIARGIKDPNVLSAMGSVPRHEFVREQHRDSAYADSPLPIGEGQTISQPYIVALMTELAQVDKASRVLEVGTGSGYQAAVLHDVAGEVYSIEIIEGLAQSARENLPRLGYGSIRLRHGDGYRGWPEAGPFDAILVTAAPAVVPEPLKEQLAVGGRLVVPVGKSVQELLVFTRTAGGFERESIIPVIFVPMTGEIQTLEKTQP